MGTSGIGFLCWKGHLFDWIDSDRFEEIEAIKERGCPCGSKTLTIISQSSDPLYRDIPLERFGSAPITVKTEIVDSRGRPEEVLMPLEFPLYKVSDMVQALVRR